MFFSKKFLLGLLLIGSTFLLAAPAMGVLSKPVQDLAVSVREFSESKSDVSKMKIRSANIAITLQKRVKSPSKIDLGFFETNFSDSFFDFIRDDLKGFVAYEVKLNLLKILNYLKRMFEKDSSGYAKASIMAQKYNSLIDESVGVLNSDADFKIWVKNNRPLVGAEMLKLMGL